MRKRNWRLVGFAVFLLILETVGSASGTVGGLSIALIIIGLIGKKA